MWINETGRPVKKIAIVPTLCTLGNACCGFAAIAYASRVQSGNSALAEESLYYFAISGWLIFGAMLFDLFDGYLARLSKTASEFGAQLDSLCDVVSFGVAPAFLLLRLGAGIEHRVNRDLLILLATLYMICAILRLARFNVQTSTDAKSHRVFRGLPSPAAAGCIASMAVTRSEVVSRYGMLDEWVAGMVSATINWMAPLCALVAAFLMVSRIPYSHIAGRFLTRRRHSFGVLVQVILALFAIVLFQEVALLLTFWGYAITGPVRFFWSRAARVRHLKGRLKSVDDPRPKS